METVAQIPKYTLNDEQEKKLMLREYRSLLKCLKSRIKPGDRKLIRLAFEMAVDAHKTMRRKSGEPYILPSLASIVKALIFILNSPDIRLVILFTTPTSSSPMIFNPVKKEISLFFAHLVFTIRCP